MYRTPHTQQARQGIVSALLEIQEYTEEPSPEPLQRALAAVEATAQQLRFELVVLLDPTDGKRRRVVSRNPARPLS